MRDVVAVIPLKALALAKGRMATELDAAQRRELALWMLGRVVTACRNSQNVARVVVIAGDEDGARAAAHHGAEVLRETRPGLRAALDQADAVLSDALATLVVAADLPGATAADIDLLISAGMAQPTVVVAPTRDGGTGALLRRPAGVIATAYGPGSAAAHVAAAEAAGIRAVTLSVPNLAMDIDTPAQLAAMGHTFPLPGSSA